MKSVASARAAWRACRPLPYPGVAGLVFFNAPQGQQFYWATDYLQRHAQRRGR